MSKRKGLAKRHSRGRKWFNMRKRSKVVQDDGKKQEEKVHVMDKCRYGHVMFRAGRLTLPLMISKKGNWSRDLK